MQHGPVGRAGREHDGEARRRPVTRARPRSPGADILARVRSNRAEAARTSASARVTSTLPAPPSSSAATIAATCSGSSPQQAPPPGLPAAAHGADRRGRSPDPGTAAPRSRSSASLGSTSPRRTASSSSVSSARSPPMHRSIVRCRVRRRGNLGRTPAPARRGRGAAARHGRFMDDLDPLPGTAHAADPALDRSAHARIASLDAVPALEPRRRARRADGGRRRASCRGRFPSALERPDPVLRRRREVARYVGEPVCVVVARDRYVAEDALERDRGRLRAAAGPAMDAALAGDAADRRASARTSRPQLRVRRPGRGLRPRPPRRARALPPSHARSATPVECYGVVADWDAATATLTAWANFQGPFTLHGVAAAALGIPAARLRLLTPADSRRLATASRRRSTPTSCSWGSRRASSACRCAGSRTGVEHLLASSASTGALHGGRGGVRRGRRAAGAAARRSWTTSAPTSALPSRPRSTACTAA